MKRRDFVRNSAVVLSSAALTCSFATRTRAQSVAQFYKGRTIDLLIASAPGGVNDIAGRLVGRHIGRFIAGNPAIVPQNFAGASGITVANRLYNGAARDGSVIAIVERAVPQLALQGDPNAKFDPLNMLWLGSLSSYANDAYLLIVNAKSPVQFAADLRANMSAVIGVANAQGGTTLAFGIIARDLLGLRLDIIRGYAGAAPTFLAMQSGEIDGQIIGLAALKAAQPALWREGLVRPLVQFARVSRLPELAEVPTGRELVRNTADLALLQFAEQPFFMALPFVAPPDVPPDRTAALQDAFTAMTRDPAFIADAQALGLETSPIDGAAIRRLLLQSNATPKDIIARYNRIVGLAQ